MTGGLPAEVPVIFDSVIEGFARTYGPRVTPQLRAELAALGVDLDRIVPAYTLEVFERAMRRAGEVLYPDLDGAARWRHMGREFVEGYVATALGKAALAMGKVLGPKRTLQRVARTFRTGANYLDVESQAVGPAHIELRTWMLDAYLPEWRGREMMHLDYRHGVLEGMMHALGAKDATVELLDKDFGTQSGTYRIRWRE